MPGDASAEPTGDGPPADGPPSATEATQLLPKINGADGAETPHEDDFAYQDDEEAKAPQWRLVLRELAILSRGAFPVIAAYALQMSLQTLSIVVVGRRSPQDLAAAAFAYMFAMATGWLIGLGGTTALDTLASSTFTGSKNRHDLGVLLQRAFFVLGLMFVPVAVVWVVSEPILLALHQTPQIAHDSSRFLWCLIPGGFGYIFFETMKKYLQAQGATLLT